MKQFLASIVALLIPITIAANSNPQLLGCGDPTIDATISPSFGPEVGGTVTQLTNLKTCLDERISVYCRFDKTVVVGIRVNESKIECISPPSNGESSIEVSYAVLASDSDYDPDLVEWNNVSDMFDYDGDLSGVVITPTFGDEESSRLMFAERMYKVQWNSNSLLLSAIASNTVSSRLSIDLEVVAFTGHNLDQDLRFQVVQTLEIDSNNINTIQMTISDEAIAPAINNYQAGIKKVGFLIVRIVAYTATSGLRRVHATRSSKLIGVLPGDADTTTNTCPVAPLDYCDQNSSDTPPPCPSTYDYAENDFDFYPDETCVYPSGISECVVASDIDGDHLETCREFERNPFFDEYCEGIDFDGELTENCDCNYFHPGAAGCIRNGPSQCCYSTSGGLILDPDDGGGTRDCSSNGFLNHFLHDILPYIYCCKLNDDCNTYFAARPPVSDENYEVPELSYSFGDPHLESFDHINFDFNGYAEFVAFCGLYNGDSVATNLDNCQPNSNNVLNRGDTISVHYRFAQLDESHNGTVTVGVSIEDFTFREGTTPLTIVTDPVERLAVYDGSNKLIFPISQKRPNRMRRKRKSGAKMYMTPNPSYENFDVRIVLTSGLKLRISENGLGVITVGFLTKPEGSVNHVGLLGIPDGDSTNDFTSANGTILDMSVYEPLAKGYETIFHDFGKTWMVPEKSSSLFKYLSGSNDFHMFHFPDYEPDFTYFGEGRRLAAAPNCYEDICSRYTGYLRESCCFDYDVTKNSELVNAMMVDAEREDNIRTILNNTIPTIEGKRRQSATVAIGQNTTFIIKASDRDGNDLTATLERNDENLFDLSAYSPGVFRLLFAGTQNTKCRRARVGISDGNSTVLFHAKVNIASPPCINDEFFRHKGNSRKSCTWMGLKETRRRKFCSDERENVREACRSTCGLCCEDKPDFKFKNDQGDHVGCRWIRKKDLRSDMYCERKQIKKNCANTCNSCQSKILMVNNNNFFLDKANKQGSCVWIGEEESRRMKYCGNSKVRHNCPTTCGLSCENNPNFLFETETGEPRGCKWLTGKTAMISKYCPQPLVSASCPGRRACNSCKTYIEGKSQASGLSTEMNIFSLKPRDEATNVFRLRTRNESGKHR